MNKSRFTITLLSLFVLASLVLSACGGGAATVIRVNGIVKLVAGGGAGSGGAGSNYWNDIYNESNPATGTSGSTNGGTGGDRGGDPEGVDNTSVVLGVGISTGARRNGVCIGVDGGQSQRDVGCE